MDRVVIVDIGFPSNARGWKGGRRSVPQLSPEWRVVAGVEDDALEEGPCLASF